MKNYMLRYGLIGGCVSITLGLINWFTVARFGPIPSQTVGYLSIILSLMCVPLGVKYFRDRLNDGKVQFTKAFRIGLGITLVASTVNMFYGMLFFLFAGDSFEEWSKQGLTQAQLLEREAQLAQNPEFVGTPWFQGFLFFLLLMTIGAIISLISAFILRRSGNARGEHI
ncbi:MAG: DUF4199 domain-containing protein [Pyrinomonadaceae bacterium]|nr:DUF4199 domain-containing protein [Pyrinomonadaceae bacterium]